MSVQSGSPRGRRSRVKLISALSNLSIQYNFSAIALALAIMDNCPPLEANGTITFNCSVDPNPAYPRLDWQSSLLRSLVFAGAIAGQLCMGLAGDLLGRRKAMLLTNSFSMVGSLGSAIFTWGPPGSVYGILGACRFLLGVGVGGKYPLAAIMSKEEDAAAAPASATVVDRDAKERNKSVDVALGFFWQTPGAMLPYVVGIALVGLVGKSTDTAQHAVYASTQFRLLLGLGALPTLVTTVLTYLESESEEYATAARSGSANPCRAAAQHPQLLGRLAGCGLSWLLYDFLYYGTTMNQVDITKKVFGNSDALFAACWQNVVVAAMGLPGVLLAIGALRCRWTSHALQLGGFVLLALVCLALAAANHYQAPESAMFALFCVLLLALNFGPNVSTYTIPTEAFPTAVRSTFFGLAAGMGKVGALIGAAVFEPLVGAIGFAGVYLMCAGVAILGCIITLLLVPRHGAQALQRDVLDGTPQRQERLLGGVGNHGAGP
jgi:PHS family inorganic phosphate transporter-like MFS transporter